jgi:hypothetical protein
LSVRLCQGMRNPLEVDFAQPKFLC